MWRSSAAGSPVCAAPTRWCERGVDVVVLEARDRVGGRVFSHHFSDGQTCERGAEFIDSNHAEVLALAARLGLTLTSRTADLDPDATLIDAGGRAVPMSMHASIEPDLARWDARRRRAGRRRCSRAGHVGRSDALASTCRCIRGW